MAEGNDTLVSEFILHGFTNHQELQMLCFIVFLAIYVATVLGNLGMIMLIRTDSHLQTPMYFFLSHLSLLDLFFSSTVIPQTLLTFLAKRKAISFTRCAAQLFFFATCATTECYLLAAMAYDRYMAICDPLLYRVTMSQRVCVVMVVSAYIAGAVSSTIHTVSIFRLPFCHSNKINHFFCDGPPLLALSCSDTYVNEMALFAVVGFNVVSTTVVILASYVSILATILRIRSTESKYKAFSTCVSHLTTVSLFYGSSLFMYLRPTSRYSLDHDRIVSVFYSVTTPVLNPLIYSLRNKEVKNAWKKATRQFLSSKVKDNCS
ncbi:olfactory receptor 1019-like [Alligator sinensis]|uniref:Olfactory receptor n=1 Tax=Alligator sinensis TaxID=38654 RepID=A0A1U8D4J0_ALLSI|nr:olfactory receptor 1019-like [Alligator sinensis]XP_014372609.1 olfactory receptor 1019-like [Alligator sinensis]